MWAMVRLQVVEHFKGQELVTETTVEAFREGILPRARRFNVKRSNVELSQHSRRGSAMNSGPLSLRMNFGRPRFMEIATRVEQLGTTMGVPKCP